MYIHIIIIHLSLCIYIYIYTYIHTHVYVYTTLCSYPHLHAATVSFQISNLFLRPRPWQFEIRDSMDKQATYLLSGFETLILKFCDLKL